MADQLAADPAERFDPEGPNGPEGEWRPGKRQARLVVEAATGLERRGRRSGANRESVAERRVERVVEAAGWKRSGKAGNVDPGMESARAGFVAGERKAVASIRSRSEEDCGVLQGV